MLHSLSAIISGFLTWGALYITVSIILREAFPQLFNIFGATDDWRLLVFLLFASILYSVCAGYITAAISKHSQMMHVILLALILLGAGIYIQSLWWDLMPLWYHIPFLALLIPSTILGGDLRMRKKIIIFS